MKEMEENYNLAKWLNGELTNDQLAEFKSNPEYESFEKIRYYSKDLQIQFNKHNDDIILNNILSHKKQVKIIPIFNSWILKIAAVILISLGSLFLFQNLATTTMIAKNGETTTFLLPDSSQVVLNSSSEIAYKKIFWSSNRNLNLEGQAYFKVAKGENFEVTTSLGTITVLGTQFDVKARKNRLDVSCYEGKVKVTYQNQEVFLTKGQNIAFESGKVIDIPSSNDNKPKWLNGELFFKKERLLSIVDELNRQYNNIVILKADNVDKLFTGAVPVNNIETAMKILCSTYDLKFIKTDKNKIILMPIDAEK